FARPAVKFRSHSGEHRIPYIARLLTEEPCTRIPRHALAALPIAPLRDCRNHDPYRSAERAVEMDHRGAYADREIERRTQCGGLVVIVDRFLPMRDVNPARGAKLVELALRLAILQADEAAARRAKDRHQVRERQTAQHAARAARAAAPREADFALRSPGVEARAPALDFRGVGAQLARMRRRIVERLTEEAWQAARRQMIVSMFHILQPG